MIFKRRGKPDREFRFGAMICGTSWEHLEFEREDFELMSTWSAEKLKDYMLEIIAVRYMPNDEPQ